ncbi:cecr1 family adenosine deaminase [Niveomyces insectorum RCEF 264]|uniref:Cecr1 family adenosine deaminase n=1 Tax=Niveomyces insectorum RCEF 264 TaxID=1081102 RepID=A0A167Q7I7_9HYPO|nr:cecr1 family adenosine deaminase [Niveomyces insectorum RCEF 264]
MGFTDEEWAEVVQDMPSPDDPVIQQYMKGRTNLLAEESKQRSAKDYAFRQALSPIARKACAIVERIREDEQRRIWTPSLEENLATGAAAVTGVSVGEHEQDRGRRNSMPLYPGQMFTHAKALMETTTLWKIVRRLPKGALLHAHCDAMVNFDFVIRELLATPGLHVVAPAGPLATPEQRAERLVSFVYRATARPIVTTDASRASGGQTPPNPPPWDPAYVAGTPVLLTDAADAFPTADGTPDEDGQGGDGNAGGRAAFVAWLKSRCTISPTDAVEQHHGVDHIWKKFRGCFAMLGGLIHYEPVWRAFLRQFLRQLWDDRVAWAEVRVMWPLNYHRERSEVPETDYLHAYQVADEEIEAFRAAHPGFWGLRFIWTPLRGLPTRGLLEAMDHCLTTKLAYPHLVAGFDLVGQEDAGRPLRDLLPELFWFRRQCAAEGVEVPLFLHAGECLGDGDATDQNVADAVLLGARRLGHGFSLYKHPLLVDLVRERRILVEACPISNEVLRLCGSILSHPLPALLARGVACSLNNDDPAILGQDAAGTTHDFWQALQGWDNLGLAGLGALAENSVRWAAFEDQDQAAWLRDVREASLGAGVKAERLKAWSIAWEQFCLWVVTEYGEAYGEDDD